MKHFLDKLKDQRRFIATQLEQANRSLDDFGENMKKQTETLRDEVNNLSADLFQNEQNQRNDTEYTVGHVNINTNNIDYRTPGHLTEREDRLFKSLQDLLNKAGFRIFSEMWQLKVKNAYSDPLDFKHFSCRTNRLQAACSRKGHVIGPLNIFGTHQKCLQSYMVHIICFSYPSLH